VEDVETSRRWFHFLICACWLWALPALGQVTAVPEIPPQFKLDLEMAARLRPELMAQSVAATGSYITGCLVFERIVQLAQTTSNLKPTWQLRIVEDDQLNAYASPDGTVYVENGLAKLAGESAGLWAAILSHEIAHVVRRDWARRYLLQKHLEGTGANIVLGDPGLFSGSWSDTEKTSADMGRFCRRLELEADRDGLVLMAKAGYHPDFVPALHHLLHAHGSGASHSSQTAMHPCWEERDRELAQAYQQASVEFEHRWLDWHVSPGGNPPVVVFADPPAIKKTRSRQWQIQVPMRCQNLVGAVEVVLRADSGHERLSSDRLSEGSDGNDEVRQLTGCTSPRTTVVFTVDDLLVKQTPITKWTDVYVIDSWGAILARSDLPKLPH
jgi:Zn-dependent protease with chaperone function